MLLSRYSKVDRAIENTKAIDIALERVTKMKSQRRPVFSIEYHPSLPALPHIYKSTGGS